jgi:hypothetical protein
MTDYCRKASHSEVTGAVRLFRYTPKSVILTGVDQYAPVDSSQTARVMVRSMEIDGLYSIGNRRRRLPGMRITPRRSSIDDRPTSPLRRLLIGVYHPCAD